ncbi:MAG: hypothetical protein IJZ37_00825 [Clostridia bacterium]|nr:hypothetical protein [Clostridia bacterium]
MLKEARTASGLPSFYKEQSMAVDFSVFSCYKAILAGYNTIRQQEATPSDQQERVSLRNACFL